MSISFCPIHQTVRPCLSEAMKYKHFAIPVYIWNTEASSIEIFLLHFSYFFTCPVASILLDSPPYTWCEFQMSLFNALLTHFKPSTPIFFLFLYLLLALNNSPPNSQIQHQTPDMESENGDTQDLIIRMREKLNLRSLDQSVRLAAVIFADKVPHKPTTIDVMKKVWASFGEIGITARDERDPIDRLFVVTVRNDEAAKEIMDNSPWSVKGYSAHVQPWPEHLAIEELPTNNIAFWIQMRGVPLYMFSMKNVEDMVEHFGAFIKMDDPLESGDGTYSFLRVRVMLDGRRPLPTGFKLPREDGGQSWVEFKFEKLSRFCFCCGRLGHIETPQNPCPNIEEERPEDIAYGEWLITSAFRRPAQQAQMQVIRPTRRRRSAGQRIEPVHRPEIRQSSHTNANQRQTDPSQCQRLGLSGDNETSLNPSDQSLSHELSPGISNGQEHPVNRQNQVRVHSAFLSFPNLLHYNSQSQSNHNVNQNPNFHTTASIPQLNTHVQEEFAMQNFMGPTITHPPPTHSHFQTNVALPHDPSTPSITTEQVDPPNGPFHPQITNNPTHHSCASTAFFSKRPIPAETSEPTIQKKVKTNPKLRTYTKIARNSSAGGNESDIRDPNDASIGGDYLQGGGGWPTATRPQ